MSEDEDQPGEVFCMLGCGTWREGIDPCPCTQAKHDESLGHEWARLVWVSNGRAWKDVPAEMRRRVLANLADEMRRVGLEHTHSRIRGLLSQHRIPILALAGGSGHAR